MNSIATILRYAEEQIEALIGEKVMVSVAFVPVKEGKAPHEWLQPGSEIRTDATSLMSLVCTEFNVSRHKLVGAAKDAHTNKARQAYIYLGNKLLRLTYREMAVHINRDRTTALHALNTVRGLVQVNDPIADKIRSIEHEFLTLNKTNDDQNNHEKCGAKGFATR
jgi:hypothetical protein